IMEDSSTITTSAGWGLPELYSHSDSSLESDFLFPSPTIPAYVDSRSESEDPVAPKALCIVYALAPVTASSRLAAIPVGAHSKKGTSASWRTLTAALRQVVLP